LRFIAPALRVVLYQVGISLIDKILGISIIVESMIRADETLSTDKLRFVNRCLRPYMFCWVSMQRSIALVSGQMICPLTLFIRMTHLDLAIQIMVDMSMEA
jgi:hypothetical protein